MRVALLWAGGMTNGGAGGLAPHLKELARTLRVSGHDAHIFSASSSHRSSSYSCEGVPVHEVRVEQRLASNRDACRSTSYFLDCLQQSGGAFSALLAYHRGFLPALGEMKRRTGASTVLWLHSDSGMHRRGAARPQRQISWTYSEAVDRIYVNSAALLDRMSKKGMVPPERLEVLYPGVALDRFGRWVDQGKVKLQWRVGPFDPLVLFVGEMTHGMGSEALLEAAFDVIHALPQARFIFVGDGPLLPFLRSRARVLGLEGLAHFVGDVPAERLADLYNACDVVCAPYRSARPDQIVLEAWSAGKPVIIARSSLPEFFAPESDGLVVKGNAESLVEALCSLLANRELGREIGNRVWHKVNESFSWAAIASRLLGVPVRYERRKAS